MKKLSSDNKWLSSNFLNLKKKLQHHFTFDCTTDNVLKIWWNSKSRNEIVQAQSSRERGFQYCFQTKNGLTNLSGWIFFLRQCGEIKEFVYHWFYVKSILTNQRYENLPLSNTTSESLKFEFDRFVQNLGLKLSKFKEFATKIIPFLSFFFFLQT